ncbi:MAG: NimC/NimA family protein [Bacilli bacterium]|nr:NimC/NimA family protein [Bacilli bacterium]
MKETFEFLKVKTQVNYVATVKEDGTPSLRPFGDPILFDDKIYVLTNKQKRVSKEIAQNNKVCIVAYDGLNWIRIHCQMIDDSDNLEAKKAMMSEFDWMTESGYTLDNPDFQILYIADAEAKVYDSDGKELESYEF